MAKLKLIIAILLMAGLAILWMVGRQSEAGLQAALQQQNDRTAQLKAELERLSNLVAQANDPTAGKQLAELQKLRDEAARLRQQSSEVQQLRAQNGQLRSALQSGNNRPTVTPAAVPDKPPLAIYPRADWVFAGYATPEAAFQSFIWANANGDTDTFLASLAPDAQQQIAKEFLNKSAAEAADMLKKQSSDYTEVRILSKNEISDHEAELEVWDNKTGTTKIYFQKIDGQWKFSPGFRPKPAQR